MIIAKLLTAPSGAPASWHSVQRLVCAFFPSNTAVVEVKSWTNQDAAAHLDPTVWTWQVTVPHSAIVGSEDLPQSLAQWIVEQPGLPWFEGAVVASQPGDLLTAQARKWAQLKQVRDGLISAQLSTAHGYVQAGTAHAANILRAALGAGLASNTGQPVMTSVILADNTEVSLTEAQLVVVALAYYTREQSIRARCQLLRGWVYHANANLDAVAQIEWDTLTRPEGTAPPLSEAHLGNASLGAPPVLPIV